MLNPGEPLVSRSVADGLGQPVSSAAYSSAARGPAALGLAVMPRTTADDWADHVYLQDLLLRVQRQPVLMSAHWQAVALIAAVSLVAWTLAA